MTMLAIRAFLSRIPWQAYAAIAAALALWWLYNTGFDNGLAKGRAELAAAVAAYEDAQEQATRLALEAKAEQERRYAELAERADNDHVRNQAAASSATDRFIDRNRVQPCPAGGATGGTSASPDDHGSEGGNRPSPPAQLVGVTEADVRICTENTTRLQAVREWAVDLAEQ